MSYYLNGPGGMAGGLLSDAYIDPMTAGFSAASQALLPLMGPTRTPTGGIGAALAAAGSGYSTGVTAARQENLKMTPLLIQQIRLNGIAQRHPDWFGAQQAQQQAKAADPSALDSQAASSPPPGPSPLQQSQDLTAQTGFSTGGSLAQQPPPDGGVSAGTGALPGQQIAAGPGAPAPLPTQAQPANAFARPGQPGGTGLPTTAQDAEDYLFLHPEMKEIVAKNFAGPTDVERAIRAAGIDPTSPQGQEMLRSAAVMATTSIENLRPGGTAFDKITRQPIYTAPVLPPGTALNNGTVDFLPGVLPANTALHDSTNRSAAQFRPLKITVPDGKGGYIETTTSEAALPSLTGAGTGVPAAGAARAPAATPAVPGVAGMPQYPAAENDARKASGERFQGWQQQSINNQPARQNIMNAVDSLKAVESGRTAAFQGELGAWLKDIGVDPVKLGLKDPVELQKLDKATTNFVVDSFKEITGQKAFAEMGFLKAGMPENIKAAGTNHSILGNMLGRINWIDDLASDAATKFPNGVPDQTYVRDFLKSHPLSKYVRDAKTQIGPLAGMTDGQEPPPAAAAAAPAPASGAAVKAAPPPDGSTKQIGKTTYVKKDGQWFPQ